VAFTHIFQFICTGTALFDFMRSNAPPGFYGYVYTLPEGLHFMFNCVKSTESMMIVRSCYERVLAIIDRSLNREDDGVLFSGAQGNSKVRGVIRLSHI
jgi:hypothetical protein